MIKRLNSYYCYNYGYRLINILIENKYLIYQNFTKKKCRLTYYQLNRDC